MRWSSNYILFNSIEVSTHVDIITSFFREKEPEERVVKQVLQDEQIAEGKSRVITWLRTNSVSLSTMPGTALASP